MSEQMRFPHWSYDPGEGAGYLYFSDEDVVRTDRIPTRRGTVLLDTDNRGHAVGIEVIL